MTMRLKDDIESVFHYCATGRRAEAEVLLRRLVQSGVDNPLLLHRLAGLAFQLEQYDCASAFLEKAVQQGPDVVDFVVDLGVAYRRRGLKEAAESSYRRAISLDPSHASAHNNLGNVLRDGGRLLAAAESYQRAVNLRADYVDAIRNLGNVLNDLGQFREAEELLRRALALRPADAEMYNDLGNVLQNIERYSDAEVCYRKCLTIQARSADAYSNLGRALTALGRFKEAEDALRHALLIRPAYVEAHNNLGLLLRDLGRLNEAEHSFRRALALNPERADTLNNLGNVLHDLGRLEEAVHDYRRALEIDPQLAGVHGNLANVLKDRGELQDAIISYGRALELQPRFAGAHSNLIFALDLIDTTGLKEQQQERNKWYRQHGEPLLKEMPCYLNERDPGRRLRIGYVSADFRIHSAYFALAPIICNHSPEEFDVFCYSGVKREDQATARLRKVVSNWRSTLGMSDESLAAQIKSDGIDILIDLSGHSAGNRLLVFARKPAPVQVTAWGHATGTGLKTMDYLFADQIVLPQAERSLFAEKIVDLPCVICYEPPPYLPSVNPLPALAGNPLTFGFVNRLEKLTDRAIALWGQVLHMIPDARLLIKDKGLNDCHVKEDLLERLRHVGKVPPSRVVLHGPSPHPEHLKIFHAIDIEFDPFPQGGGISTAEALWMGVPIITKFGSTISSRLSASFLTSAGMSQWVARSDEEYVSIAVQAGRNPHRLSAIRSRLRDRMNHSPVGDLMSYTTAVENAYRDMWREWCNVSKG